MLFSVKPEILIKVFTNRGKHELCANNCPGSRAYWDKTIHAPECKQYSHCILSGKAVVRKKVGKGVCGSGSFQGFARTDFCVEAQYACDADDARESKYMN